MAKRCELCGKGPLTGNSLTRKGKPKREGGIGEHIARVNRRRFMPNLQSARAFFDGRVQRIRVCTKCIKAGKLVRASA
jgi:large subunit ribosomal protein L28